MAASGSCRRRKWASRMIRTVIWWVARSNSWEGSLKAFKVWRRDRELTARRAKPTFLINLRAPRKSGRKRRRTVDTATCLLMSQRMVAASRKIQIPSRHLRWIWAAQRVMGLRAAVTPKLKRREKRWRKWQARGRRKTRHTRWWYNLKLKDILRASLLRAMMWASKAALSHFTCQSRQKLTRTSIKTWFNHQIKTVCQIIWKLIKKVESSPSTLPPATRICNRNWATQCSSHSWIHYSSSSDYHRWTMSVLTQIVIRVAASHSFREEMDSKIMQEITERIFSSDKAS